MSSQTNDNVSLNTKQLSKRTLKTLLHLSEMHWVGNGFRVCSIIHPQSKIKPIETSPFLLFDYHPPYKYEPNSGKPRGVGPHPHRGFETVTVAFQGSVAHHDSAGNAGVVAPGDVQWMTAGSGLLHMEYHEKEFSQKGGIMHMAQIWVNLPKVHKMHPPKYQAITSNTIPQVLGENGSTTRMIAGSYQNEKGPATTFSDLNLFEIHVPKQSSWNTVLPKTQNVMLLVMKGEIRLPSGDEVKENELALLEHDGDTVAFETMLSEAHVLLLSGEPIHEPVAHYGPFAMNTESELKQAILDFQRGAFGVLKDHED